MPVASEREAHVPRKSSHVMDDLRARSKRAATASDTGGAESAVAILPQRAGRQALPAARAMTEAADSPVVLAHSRRMLARLTALLIVPAALVMLLGCLEVAHPFEPSGVAISTLHRHVTTAPLRSVEQPATVGQALPAAQPHPILLLLACQLVAVVASALLAAARTLPAPARVSVRDTLPRVPASEYTLSSSRRLCALLGSFRN
ncbi:hypothetical protein OO015_12105 [Thermomicrobium sp. 4228-Ro]|uniref:hypothetical protein n=1 Tax=Thermomicrobium sp. 4228-Ro TaxID=2993937 RepID=UPI002248A89B|nr:hypothetical protein [Thermomicrobium sp. 4228-Ro]MCX2728233.1 hypothetical protein [Thermomicrobium sp. 4228-Ro]